jgi:hypothetical protein
MVICVTLKLNHLKQTKILKNRLNAILIDKSFQCNSVKLKKCETNFYPIFFIKIANL